MVFVTAVLVLEFAAHLQLNRGIDIHVRHVCRHVRKIETSDC